MSNTFNLTATIRNELGTSASRRLRHAGKVPGIVYGANKNPQTINLEHRTLIRSLENESFYSQVLTLDIEGTKEKVILRDLQRHPYKRKILHIDFQRISAKEKLAMHIPLHFIGGDIAPGVKLSGGNISHLLTEIEIRCLPADLPEYLEIDLSKLELNQTVYLSDIKLPKGVEIIDLAVHDTNKPIATVYTPRVAAEPETAAEEAVTEEEGAEETAEEESEIKGEE